MKMAIQINKSSTSLTSIDGKLMSDGHSFCDIKGSMLLRVQSN